jgi:hypothetical protein
VPANEKAVSLNVHRYIGVERMQEDDGRYKLHAGEERMTLPTAAAADFRPSEHGGGGTEAQQQQLDAAGRSWDNAQTSSHSKKPTSGEQMRALLHSKDFWAVSGLNTALFFSGAGGRTTLLPLLAVHNFGYSPAGLGAIFTAGLSLHSRVSLDWLHMDHAGCH